MSKFQAIFSGAIAYILLTLYVGIVGYMVYMVAAYQTKEFTSGVTYIVTTVGGLVSALVIGKLAITPPKDPPSLTTAAAAGGPPDPLNVWLTVAYMVVWLLAGLAALIVGVLLFSDVNKLLAGIGTNWLGLAVAAGYAYFGVKP
jgi:hypothetical protein